eukprot:CAMPEP_0115843736 /NCGR_PEP_ID=MMETSP0287-20121206/8468_1 /TAXON_ID=412157 /ORGANISM="Chrysochromulina rotalis, Strain UIO044" /LENGTH=167 /DNA_ID=CAMNT_0003297443 /DNA_START=92 /DNA_END=596 /DNA_ORIENTATION=+
MRWPRGYALSLSALGYNRANNAPSHPPQSARVGLNDCIVPTTQDRITPTTTGLKAPKPRAANAHEAPKPCAANAHDFPKACAASLHDVAHACARTGLRRHAGVAADARGASGVARMAAAVTRADVVVPNHLRTTRQTALPPGDGDGTAAKFIALLPPSGLCKTLASP